MALAAVRRSLQLPPDAELAILTRPVEENPLRLFLRSLSPIATGLSTLLRAVDLSGAKLDTAVGPPLVVR